jgi:hypothetical protein
MGENHSRTGTGTGLGLSRLGGPLLDVEAEDDPLAGTALQAEGQGVRAEGHRLADPL